MPNFRSLKLQRSGKNISSKIRKARKITGKLIPIIFVIGLLMIAWVFLSTFSGSSSVVTQILSGTSLKNSGGRVNVLLLGIPGGRHDGAELTDTIIVASYEIKSNNLTFISIPRDLWLPALAAKANTVYQMGLEQRNGLGFAKTVMGNIVGLPIHYVLRVDFRGFERAVNILEGLEISVDQTFDDYNYPIEGKENDLCGWEEHEIDFSEDQAKKLNISPGKKRVFVNPEGKIATDSAEEDKGPKYFSCRYERLHFEKGPNFMDGATALKFVRSRHGTNGEASDFARSKRQQKTLEAFKEKLLTFETLTSPAKLTELLTTFDRSIDTDMAVKDAVEFFKLSRKMDKISSFVLGDRVFIHPPREKYGGAYVLVSLDDDFSTTHEYVRKILQGIISEYDATTSARAR